MTETEATGFASRYKNIWRGGPSVDELRSEFTQMDAGTLGTALVRLKRDLDDPPSIARIWREYRQLDTPANNPIPIDCGVCAGDGWTTHEFTVEGRPYRGVVPCAVCGHSKSTDKTWSKVWDSLTIDGAISRHPARLIA